MLRRVAVVCSIMSCVAFMYWAVLSGPQINKANDRVLTGGTDEVMWVNKMEVPLLFAQVPTPPASPCTVVSYAPCNYLIPANDYVAFDLAPAINLAVGCLAANLNTVNITFEATPTAPLLVWLQTASGTNSTPVYMTTSSITLPTGYFGAATTSWFSGTNTWTKLCVQVIYPNPPPTTFYYPQSCTIVYQ